jgi:3-hydroxyisobutyrate dehydrogenase-like beta-hydroxyacid dehydrogenase
MATVAFLGTGLLGSAMVESMLARGESVVVWNRTAEKLAPLVAKGARAAASPAAAVAGASRVHLCLSDDAAVDSVLENARAALVNVPVLDHTTVAPAGVVARAARLEAASIPYQPAPVFMGPQNARENSGIMLASGPRERFDRCQPLLAPMTGELRWLGERIDLAAAYKLFGNALFISVVGALADVFQIARGADLPESAPLEVLRMINPAAAMGGRGARMARGEYAPATFELTMARKDVRLMLQTAGDRPMSVLPGIAAAMDRYIAAGEGHLDMGVLGRR